MVCSDAKATHPEVKKPTTTQVVTGMRQQKQWRLCVLLSQGLCPSGDWWRVAAAVVDSARQTQEHLCIQLREKNLDDRQLLSRARRLVEACRPAGVDVVVNDRPDVALLAGANGVHLGQTDLPCHEVREMVGDRLIIGVSTADLDQARQAAQDGADYCGVGPMFASTTKPKKTISGPPYLHQFLEAFDDMPHLAIGGINTRNIDYLIAAGVGGVAVSSSVCGEADPKASLEQLLRSFKDVNQA